MYLTDPKISSNEQTLGVVKRLRDGSWELGLGIIEIIILIASMSNGFLVRPPTNPGPKLIFPDLFFGPNQYHERQTPLDKFFRQSRTLSSQLRPPFSFYFTDYASVRYATCRI